uniref:Uncharacterized protein n=1 Tax=Leersia perrieri TaxID=77586 RepID=A0A0D9X6C7_9ORYZ
MANWVSLAKGCKFWHHIGGYRTFSTLQAEVVTVGIDFGCKSSRIAVIESLVPKVISSEIGNLTPSYVTMIQPNSAVPCGWGLQHLDSVGKRIIVGEMAKRQILRHPSDVIFNIKKLIGKQFDDYDIEQMRKKVPFSIVEGPSGEAWVEIHGRKFSPVEMTQAIFAKLKDIIQMNQFCHVLKVVISVPTFFSGKQRQDIISAGNRAGFEILQLIDEPIAAALASTTVKEGLIVVFGMGSGSHSISVLHVSGTEFEIKAQFDDPSVGGDQFDDLLLEYVVREITRIHLVDIRGDKLVMMRLAEEVEKTKVRLSTQPTVEVSIPLLTGSAQGPIDLNITVSRKKFEDLIGHLVEQIQVNCQKMLKEAKLIDEDICEIIIMGGMARMPKIQRIVSEIFGKRLSTRVNPEEAIVIGSSLQAALIVEGHREMEKDFMPLSIGVKSAKGIFMRIIPRHTTLPTKRTLKGDRHVKTAVKKFPIREVALKLDSSNAVKTALLDWPMHTMVIRARLRNLAKLMMNTLVDVLSVRKHELPKNLCEDAVEAYDDLRMALDLDVDDYVLGCRMRAAQSVESKMLRWRLPSVSL